MSRKFRMGIIGFGNIGKVHARVTEKLPNVKLVAVADRSRENIATATREYDCSTYVDYKEMFRKEQLDLVAVCTPSGERLDICKAAANAGVHLLVEKPLDITIDRCDQILEIARKAEIKLGCVFQLRFIPLYHALKQSVEEGKFGRLIMGNAATICYRSEDYYKDGGWRGTKEQDGGGALMNQGIHNLDLLLWIMGDAKSVMAYANNLTHDIEVEDTLTASIEFENGAMGAIQATTSVYHGINKKLEVFGTDGSVIILGDDPILWKLGQANEEEVKMARGDDSVSPTSPLVEDTWAHEQAISDMLEAIAHDREPFIPGLDGKKATELALAIYKSAETGERVYLPMS